MSIGGRAGRRSELEWIASWWAVLVVDYCLIVAQWIIIVVLQYDPTPPIKSMSLKMMAVHSIS